MKTRNRYLFLTILSSILFLMSFAHLIIALFTKYFDESFFYLILMLFTTFLAIGFMYSLSKFSEFNTLIQARRKENYFTLGKYTDFYNLSYFETRVTKVDNARNLFKEKSVIVFSTTSLNLNIQEIGQHDGANLNYLVSVAMGNFFNKKSNYNSKNFIYCFNNGVFIIYAIAKSAEVSNLCNDISNMIYKVVDENDLKIWVQPFFGVYEIKQSINIYEAIEKAVKARRIAELNFESISYYEDSMDSSEESNEKDRILDGLENNEFVVHYQPKYSIKEQKFVSSEALIRWNSKKYGFMAPARFIPMAERLGLIHLLDMYVFETVCKDLSDSKKKGRRLLPVSVNFSLYEFYKTSFLDYILETLSKYNVDPHLIQLEIVETTSLANKFLSTTIIKKLQERGIKVLMDDFGTGYSQISNFSNIPFDGIKIDKSLIDPIERDDKAREIIKFIINLAHTSKQDIEIIAEGVTSKEQFEILKRLKCDTIQGFYFSEALNKREYDALLKHNTIEKKEVKNV